MKPVELMNKGEREEYYRARRRALLAGDDGVLPDGKTCRETREEYVELCNNDPRRTLTQVEGDAAAAVLEGEEFPIGQAVAPESVEVSTDPDLANKRCC